MLFCVLPSNNYVLLVTEFCGVSDPDEGLRSTNKRVYKTHTTRLGYKLVIYRLAGAWSGDTPNMSRLPREMGFPRNLGSASAPPRFLGNPISLRAGTYSVYPPPSPG
eukprot:jgi/Botrbrau1/13222/Bobra.9_1s0011.1